jgi:hypothetical protein
MRLTANIPDRVVRDLKYQAVQEGKSVSSLVTELVEYGLKNKRKRVAKAHILGMIGKVAVDRDTLKILDEMRSGDDRA